MGSYGGGYEDNSWVIFLILILLLLGSGSGNGGGYGGHYGA